MTDVMKLEEQFAILTEGERSQAPGRVLKHGESFAVFDPHGDIVPGPASEHGLYHAGTRFLSRFELLLGSLPPLLLSSSISDDNTVFTADLTNPDVVKDGHVMLGRGVLHLFRSRVLHDGSWIECWRISNHALHSIEAPLCLRFDADFADVFEVRGTRSAWPAAAGCARQRVGLALSRPGWHRATDADSILTARAPSSRRKIAGLSLDGGAARLRGRRDHHRVRTGR
jgi:glycogen debranching enzyme